LIAYAIKLFCVRDTSQKLGRAGALIKTTKVWKFEFVALSLKRPGGDTGLFLHPKQSHSDFLYRLG
jgi:hypothetical protein